MASSASDSDGTRQLNSPGKPNGSRLVVKIVNRGQAASNSTAIAPHASRRCSQLSSNSRVFFSLKKRTSSSMVERPG